MEIEKVQRERKTARRERFVFFGGKEPPKKKQLEKEEEKLGPRFSHAHAKSESR